MNPVIPLFPLGTVLFPGLVLPLRVFERRYLAMVRKLRDLPDDQPREFGVVAIQRGLEAGDATATFYPVGCTAEVRRITERPDGRFDLVTVGRRRFEITTIVADAGAYPRAEVRYLPDQSTSAEADSLGPRVLSLFRAYLRLLQGGSAEANEQLPEDPIVISHVVAATASITVADRQELLEAPDPAARLRAEIRLLHREIALLRRVRAVPATMSDLAVTPGPN